MGNKTGNRRQVRKKREGSFKAVGSSRPPFLSACMIVRDEENNLHRCLTSIKNVVDEIVVVDTGSEDKTVEIAKSFGAKVFHHPWEGDFSKHRNQSISYAKGKWIFIIDADEELVLDQPASVVQQLLRKIPLEVYVATMSLKDIQQGHIVMEFNTARFFRNGSIEYKGIIHNQPQTKGGAAFLKHMSLSHYGYDLTPEKKRKKFIRTSTALFDRLKKTPTDYSCYFYLSQIYADSFMYDECVKYGEIYREHKEDLKATGEGNFNRSIYFTVIHNYMKLSNQDKAREWLMEGLKEVPGDIDLAMSATEFGVWSGDSDMVISGARDFIELYKRYTTDPTAKMNRFIYSLKPEALAYCSMYLTVTQLREGMRALDLFNGALEQTEAQFQNGMLNTLKKELESSKIPININITSPKEKVTKLPSRQRPAFQVPMGLNLPQSVGIGGAK